MTIFDSIRFPISDKPTFAELEALPAELFEEFCMRAGASITISRVMTFILISHIDWDERVLLLRRTILEYDT